MYVVNQHSQLECARILGISQITLCRKLKEHGLKARTNLESHHTKRYKKEHSHKGFRFQKGCYNYQYKDGSASYRKYKTLMSVSSCHLCSEEKKQIVIHHKDFDRTNNLLWNLMPLCNPCHRREHKIYESRYGFCTNYETENARLHALKLA